MMDIVVATNNKGKLSEIKKILSSHNVLSQSDVGADIEVDETGVTYEENAFLKAEAIRAYTDKIIIADDSGLEVDVLDGAPGLYSARYAGEGTTPMQGIEKLLFNLKDYKPEEKTARFVSCIALLMPNGEKHTFRGECEGLIIDELRGENGFGFDPVFYVEDFKRTFSEISDEEKNSISHRFKALEKLRDFLDTI
ncbi:MAG: XTP/dITP diphosphatase [Ruminococcaceae bacterium]|nr:XTP/dITP diphosphatase [Oscillospiraceae bacterium]